jgi:hypothetical protein
MPRQRRTFKLEPTDLRAAPARRYAAGRARCEAVPLEAHAEFAAGARTDLEVELCGDAHLGNFRWYHAPTRELVFDLNDFDETLPGPFEWDVKRLAASITVAGRASGLTKQQARRATRSAMRDYRKSIAETAARNPLDLHYYRFESRGALERIGTRGKSHRKWKEAVLAKATRRNSMLALEKLTKVVKGRRRIVPDPPLIVRVNDKIASAGGRAVTECLDGYRQSLSLNHRLLFDRFTLVDVARKVVGVGSVGTRCLIALFEAGDGTPLFLQLKQATPSVLEPHLGASSFEHAGQRVVEGQRLIQATSDVLLGWSRWRESRGRKNCTLRCRRLFQCNGCGRQTSVTAGTLFADSKLALDVWFLAMHLITQAKSGLPSLELSRQLGISQNSAWLMKHKLMQAMLERDGARPLAGRVQLDDAYWGGLRACPDRHERPGHRPTSPGAQLGRHHARQRQERHPRHLPCDPSQASAALPGRIQLSLQSTLRSGQHASTAGHRRRTNTPDALSARNVG